MNRVAVVDYGMSNLDSVVRAVQECGGDAFVASTPDGLGDCSRVILPGVGTFADGMRHLRERGFEEALRDLALEKGVPFLGICLGMQLLASRGEEGGETRGLGFIPGDVLRLLPGPQKERVPHVGWNEVRHGGAGLFTEVPDGTDFYFVHSYHLAPSRPADVVARTPYCGGFVSAVASGPVYGVQFHPEKSQKLGFRVLRNFLRI